MIAHSNGDTSRRVMLLVAIPVRALAMNYCYIQLYKSTSMAIIVVYGIVAKQY